MGVEERWEIEDDLGRRVIVQPSEPKARRTGWRWLALGLAAIVFAVQFVSSAQPAAAPSTEEEQAPGLPASFEPFVAQEALALARGDETAFIALQDPSDPQWRDAQRELIRAWQTPSLDTLPYEIMATGRLDTGRAWADVRQLRGFGYVRETRFFKQRDGGWVRARPDLTFWGPERSFDTVHFRVVYAVGDGDLIQHAAARFEAAYARMCVDLGCRLQPEYSYQYGAEPVWYSYYPIWYSPFPRVVSMTLIMLPQIDRGAWDVVDRGQDMTFILPSPRTAGVVDRWLGQTDPVDQRIYESLAAAVARVATGGPARWAERRDGELFLDALIEWERDALRPLTVTRLRYAPPPADFLGDDMPSLASLWDVPLEEATALQKRQALSVVIYIGRDAGQDSCVYSGRVTRCEEIYGLPAFARTMATAHSLREVIEVGLDTDYDDFLARWRTWLFMENTR